MTWSRIRHFHREPALISAWQRTLGPALRWLTPTRRRLLLAAAALVLAVTRPLGELGKIRRLTGSAPEPTDQVLVVALLFAFVWLCYLAARRYGSLPAPVRRHPQLCLHAVLWVLVGVLWIAPPAEHPLLTPLAGCALVLSVLLWRLGYMMMTAQRGRMLGTHFPSHLLYIHPLWYGGATPYGKGYDYLSANEAKDEQALARSQLAGVKLLLLAALWIVAKGALDGLAFGEMNGYRRALGGLSLALPRMGGMLVHPDAHSIGLRWLALYLELFRSVLDRAAYGHLAIAYLRLFGFHVFRNTYKPLLAESLLEFWGRYYYYFKELLVNFFFYPTFARYFKRQPRVRIIAAVFMAAGIGNLYYHCIKMNVAIVGGDFERVWATMQSRAFYCLLLAIGISVSMLREQRRTRAARVRGPGKRLLAIFGVWTFFSIINIWSHGVHPFAGRVKFLLGLFGLT